MTGVLHSGSDGKYQKQKQADRRGGTEAAEEMEDFKDIFSSNQSDFYLD